MLTGAVTSVELSEQSVSVGQVIGGTGQNGLRGAVPPGDRLSPVDPNADPRRHSPREGGVRRRRSGEAPANGSGTDDAARPRQGQDGVAVGRPRPEARPELARGEEDGALFQAFGSWPVSSPGASVSSPGASWAGASSAA